MSLDLVTYTTGRTPRTLVADIERQVYGSHRTELNRLNDSGGISSSDGTAVLEFDLGGIRPGAYIEIDDEVLYVWSVDSVTKTATVERAMLGSTAAAHADDSVVRVEPRFTRVEMLAAISAEIRSWPTNLYARYLGSVTMPASATAVDLTGFTVEGAALLRARTGPTQDAQRWRNTYGVRLEVRQQLTDFPSGYSLAVPGAFGAATELHLTLRAPFQVSGLTTTTDLGALGIPPRLVDAIPLGVAGRMLMTRDVARTDPHAQGRSRPAEEVRTGDQLQIGRALLQERDRLLAEAANWLLAEDGMGFS